MTAVLLDRPALTMRSLALAAGIILLFRPEAVTDAGFQMSFAAVAALIAVAEWEQQRERLYPRGLVYRYLHGIVITSLAASLTTAPFALFYLKEPLKLDYLWAALCILGAVYFVFRSKFAGN